MGALLLWLFVVGVGIWVYSVGGTDVAWYSLRYRVSTDKVHVDAKPRDCDFITAPLGSKGCHYDASVIAINAAGFMVADDRQYSRDTKTGKPIFSLDKGKTWNWLPNTNEVPDPTVDKVHVSWIKVPD